MTQIPPLSRLPLFELGFVNIPAVPYWTDLAGDPDPDHITATLAELQKRGAEGLPAYAGLGTDYTIDGQTHIAFEYLYGSQLAPLATQLPLDQAEDFTLPWTTYGNVYEDSQYLAPAFAKMLWETTDATLGFWHTIASFGLPYYLLVLEKVDDKQATRFAAEFGNVWKTENLDAAQKAGLLYAIDMSILDPLEPFIARDGTTRFTPGTITLLKQDPQSKDLAPAAILVSTPNAGPPRVYGSEDAAWLWALQAAKTSITVWGIWLGHVYHLHIVTAAMQMTMFNTLRADHPLRPLLEPQSQSLIDFDFVLLTTLFNKISPPTPVSGPMALLTLVDRFAENRTFFDDDPHTELEKRGLEVADFTSPGPKPKDWDRYPVVGWLLDIWQITHDYVKAVVDVIYTNDTAVANDQDLKAWMDASSDPLQGNIRGLPDVKTRDDLTKVLTSLLYRVNAHGGGTLTPSVNPVLGFVANFPPCLQKSDIPEPGTPVPDLLERLPHTGTCGGMTTFFYTFVYSLPNVPLIPSTGITTDPLFQPPDNPCNAALFKFRQDIENFVDTYVQDWNVALAWYLGNPPGAVPMYAQNQYGQWSLSIEL
jgi:Lipoxygenase